MNGRVKGPVTGEILYAQFNGPEAKNLINKIGIKSLVLLSIKGNEYCDGDYLGATVLAATRNTAKEPTKDSAIAATASSDVEGSAEPAGENFTTFLVADEVYWHNLKTIDVNKEEARLREFYESEEKEKETESSSTSYSEFDALASEARALFPDSNLSIYTKMALAAKLAEQAKLKEEALSLGEAYLEKNLDQFLRPFGLNVPEFDLIYKYLLNNINKLNELMESLNLSHEQISKLQSAVQQAETTIDKKIALINQLAIEKQKNFEIIRWKDWVNSDPFFKENQQQIMECYSKEPSLRDSIAKTAKEFAGRHSEEGGSYEEWYFRSQGYLTEESPAVMWLGAKRNINRIIYPGEMIPCFKATRELFIVDATNPGKHPPGKLPFELHVEEPKWLVNWIPARFRREYSPEQKAAMAKPTHDKSSAVLRSPKKGSPTTTNSHGFFDKPTLIKLKSFDSLNDAVQKNQKIEKPHRLHQIVEKAVEIYQAETKSEESQLKRDEKEEVVERVESALEVLLPLDPKAFMILKIAIAEFDKRQREKTDDNYSEPSHPKEAF